MFIILSILSFLSCDFDNELDYMFSPASIINETKNKSITDSMISPVGRIHIFSKDDNKDDMGSGSAILVSDSSKSMGNDEYPYVYIYFTASHVINPINDFDEFGNLTKVNTCWSIQMWSYNSINDIKDVSYTIDLCPDNDMSKCHVYKSYMHDAAILIVYTKNKLSKINPVNIAKLKTIGDIKIGDMQYSVGCQGGIFPYIRTGIVSAIQKNLIWVSTSVNLGDSGGAAYNKDMELVGIIIGKVNHGDGGVFIPLNNIHEELLMGNRMKILKEIWK